MIVKIKMISKGETFTMMFGDSYKTWSAQFREYCSIFKPLKVVEAETSYSKWIGWGGLKWCNETEFQNELNEEGCQSGETNPNPRLYFNMNFVSDPSIKRTACAILNIFK